MLQTCLLYLHLISLVAHREVRGELERGLGCEDEGEDVVEEVEHVGVLDGHAVAWSETQTWDTR